jgi:asparagine synthase (glutamine-hydrolysing)
MKPLLPDRIVNRRKKGFGVPIGLWLRNELKEMAADLLATDRGWFDVHEVRSLLDAHLSGREDRHKELWALLMLELWFRAFIDR